MKNINLNSLRSSRTQGKYYKIISRPTDSIGVNIADDIASYTDKSIGLEDAIKNRSTLAELAEQKANQSPSFPQESIRKK